jgi:NADPH-dependent 2,4-dienoyl-CoA reductase/sulfur reductase-like enzyme
LQNQSHLSPSSQPPPAARGDVLVVSGGPAGAAIAALVAERGRRMALVEKDRHLVGLRLARVKLLYYVMRSGIRAWWTRWQDAAPEAAR